MKYTTFNPVANNALTEPMFMGNSVNVARYDQQKLILLERLTEKQLSFFWRPEEIDVSKDRIDFMGLSDAEKHIFVSNIKYQTLLDSIGARGPNIAFLPLASLPEIESWIETWAFSETIHNRSYTHIIRNLFTDPGEIFDDIVENIEIQARAADISRYYDDLIFHTQAFQAFGEGKYIVDGVEHHITERGVKKRLYLCMCAVNALESIRFYVSFACSFAFAEREILEGNSKIIKLISRDEHLHASGTTYIINLWNSGQDDPEMAEIGKECEAESLQIFTDVVAQEKRWAKYLFSKGSMLGLNDVILCQYIDFIANQRLSAIGFGSQYSTTTNPLPWMDNYIVTDNAQPAPQETEISSYLVGQVDTDVNSSDFDTFDL